MTARQQLARDNQKYGPVLRELSHEEIERARMRVGMRAPTSVWRSNRFLVQFYEEDGVVGRLSVTRTALKPKGGWEDGITWDELQRLKAEAGFGDYAAVEIYPPELSVVNVANIRHLWILRDAPSFMWNRRKEQ